MKRVSVWVVAAMLAGGLATAKTQGQEGKPLAGSVADPETTAATREQLLTLLRVSPTLTAVVASDPSLLSSQEYVAKTNPELAKFLGQHPEIGRNPEFYLFADLHAHGQNRVQALERRVWSGEPEPQRDSEAARIVDQIIPMLLTFAAIGAISWLITLLLSNRRWSRVFRLQTEVHGKLIDRFASSQEILTYMQTDAGKRFLEAAPISVDVQREERWPAVLQRVFMLLTVGIVLTLLGAGLLFVKRSVPGGETPLLLFGVVALMPGLGCMLAAGVTRLLVHRLGLVPVADRNEQ